MKGAHAEEEYLLMDILSGCIVKSCMSVTVIKNGWSTMELVFGSVNRWSATKRRGL